MDFEKDIDFNNLYKYQYLYDYVYGVSKPSNKEEDDKENVDIFSGIFSQKFLTEATERSKNQVEAPKGDNIFSKPQNIDKYAFSRGKTSIENSEKFNQKFLEEIQKLITIYDNEDDYGRKLAYTKGYSAVKNLTFEIQSVKDVEGVAGIGEKLREKIHEILLTGKLKRTESLENDTRNKTIELFKGVWGIGPSMAVSLYSRGYRTIEDLEALKSGLNRNQKIGLKYYKDLLIKIPR